MKKKASKAAKSNPDPEGFLGLDGKTWLIVGGVAVAALIAWKLYQAKKAAAPAPRPAPQPFPLPPGVTPIVPNAGMGAAAPPCPSTPQPVAEVGPEDEFGGGGELL